MRIVIEFNSKELGVVLTPPQTVEYIISRLGAIKDEQKILDPCVGPGIFIKKLIESGVGKNQIFAYDINSSFQKEIEKLGIFFKVQDTLIALYPDSYNEFDFIVGNPPYLNKASVYVRKNKIKLKKIYGNINAHETYAMFIVNSIWRLKEGGKLGFITSDSFLTLSTHKKLRRFILNNCKINEILLAPKNLFSNQNVSTSPVIIILTKCSGQKNRKLRENNKMKIIPRVNSEDDYYTPQILYENEQLKYNSLPFNIFFTDVEDEVIDLFEKAPKLEDFIQGYIGMHTHDNKRFIAAIEGTELAKIFRKRNMKIIDSDRKYRIIERENLKSNQWKPYLKRGGADQYYRPIMEALDWSKESLDNYDIPKNVPFEKEGIIISGVSTRLAARYMPRGCYWDSNKAIGFIIKEKTISIPYILGLLNSSLYNYLAKGIINNTSSIQISGIHALPFVLPDNETKEKIENLVNTIVNSKREDENYNYVLEQQEIDKIIFNFYADRLNFSMSLKDRLDQFFSIY
ncbi:MAG: N-6 DNA methylase [Candidatus Lokiarchaeota archaeon]|nr:N-6 DNA methylase [Candidatus Lokiarchaeota archaeon]